MKRKTVAAHLAISVGVSAQMMVLLGRGAIVPAIMATAIARPVEAATIVDWAFDPATRQLQVVLPSGVTPRYFLLAEPTRIVMDLPNTQVGNIPTHRTYSGQVRSVSVAQFNHRSTRIVMELAPNTVLDPQQAKLDRVAGDGQTRWVLQPLLADIAPSTVAGGVAIAAQTAEPGLDITAPGMRFSEDDPGTPLTERSPASTASATALLRPQSPAADISALPETSGDRPASSNRPTVSVPPLAEAARSAPAAAPTVTVPPLNQGLSDADGSAEVATDSNSVTDTADATSVSASPAGDPGLAITPEEASSSVAIAVEPTGPDVAEAAEASPTLPPFLSGTNLDSLESSPDLPSNSSGGNLDLPAPQAPEVEAPGVEAPEVEVPEVETPDLTALAPEDSELPSNADVEPAEVTQPEMPALAASAAVGSEPAAIAAQPPAAIAAQPIESERDSTAEIEPLPAPSAQSTEPTPSSNQSPETPSSAPPSAETVETSPPHQPSPAETINLPNSASSPTPEAEAAPPLLDSTDPAQAAPTPPPTTAAPAPTTAAPATSAPGSNNVPAITFGEPLPATERDGNLSQSSPQPASNALSAPDSASPLVVRTPILPSGTPMALIYTHTQPLVLSGNEPLQEVLVLNQAVLDETTGQVLLPQGALVLGSFEMDGPSRTFVTRALSVRGRTIPIAAVSEAVIGDADLETNTLLRNSGIGAAAFTLLTGFTGFGLIGGAALGAATTYATTPQAIVIQPNQMIEVRLVNDLDLRSLADSIARAE